MLRRKITKDRIIIMLVTASPLSTFRYVCVRVCVWIEREPKLSDLKARLVPVAQILAKKFELLCPNWAYPCFYFPNTAACTSEWRAHVCFRQGRIHILEVTNATKRTHCLVCIVICACVLPWRARLLQEWRVCTFSFSNLQLYRSIHRGHASTDR